MSSAQNSRFVGECKISPPLQQGGKTPYRLARRSPLQRSRALWRVARCRDVRTEQATAAIRQVMTTADCPECAEMLATAMSSRSTGATESVSPGDSTSDSLDAHRSSPDFASRPHAGRVQAAAISLQEHRFVVVLSQMTLVANPGEADMAIEDLQPYFGSVPVALMAQKDDGSPRYHGDSQLVSLRAGIPIDKMPWKQHAVG